jgi:hypothetical protein
LCDGLDLAASRPGDVKLLSNRKVNYVVEMDYSGFRDGDIVTAKSSRSNLTSKHDAPGMIQILVQNSFALDMGATESPTSTSTLAVTGVSSCFRLQLSSPLCPVEQSLRGLPSVTMCHFSFGHPLWSHNPEGRRRAVDIAMERMIAEMVKKPAVQRVFSGPQIVS